MGVTGRVEGGVGVKGVDQAEGAIAATATLGGLATTILATCSECTSSPEYNLAMKAFSVLSGITTFASCVALFLTRTRHADATNAPIEGGRQSHNALQVVKILSPRGEGAHMS